MNKVNASGHCDSRVAVLSGCIHAMLHCGCPMTWPRLLGYIVIFKEWYYCLYPARGIGLHATVLSLILRRILSLIRYDDTALIGLSS